MSLAERHEVLAQARPQPHERCEQRAQDAGGEFSALVAQHDLVDPRDLEACVLQLPTHLFRGVLQEVAQRLTALGDEEVAEHGPAQQQPQPVAQPGGLAW